MKKRISIISIMSMIILLIALSLAACDTMRTYQLDVPKGLTINQKAKMASWTAVDNASLGYIIKVDDTEYDAVSGTNFSLESVRGVGSHPVRVKAKGYTVSFDSYIESEYCSAVNYIVEDEGTGDEPITIKLAAPMNLSVNETTKILTWSDVANSNGYIVDIDGEEKAASINSYSLAALTEIKTYKLKVMAKGHGNYTNSAWSIEALYTINAPSYSIIYRDMFDEPFSDTFVGNYPTSHTYGTITDLVNPTKTGYRFDGWYISGDGEGSGLPLLNATSYTEDITLYAFWSPRVYSITYYDVGGGEFSGEHALFYPTYHIHDTVDYSQIFGQHMRNKDLTIVQVETY